MKCKIKSIERAFDKFESFGMILQNHPSIRIVNWDKRQYKSDDNYQYVKDFRKLSRKENERSPDTDTDTDTEYTPFISPPKGDAIPYGDIVSYLNEKAKVQFRATSKNTKQHIRARWLEGHRIDSFKTVIDNMVKAWGSDPKMHPYIRPQTLFGTKFESYLNRKEQIYAEQGTNSGHRKHFLDPEYETTDGS